MNVRQVLVLSSILASVVAVAPATAQGTAAKTARAAADNVRDHTGVLSATKRPDFCKYWPFLPLCN